jgi:cell wall-associated NlpC family hydrolase
MITRMLMQIVYSEGPTLNDCRLVFDCSGYMQQASASI